MNIAFGATVMARGVDQGHMDGIGHYSQELLSGLQGLNTTLVPVVFGPCQQTQLAGLPVHMAPRFKGQALWSVLTGMPGPGFAAIAQKADLFFAPDHYIPRTRRMPVVATIHDAVPLSHPQWVSGRMRALKNLIIRQSGHWAQHVLTVSAFSKQEIVRHYGIPESRITVTYAGVDARYFERLNEPLRRAVRQRHGLSDQFFLFVGTFQPRKNIERILQAHQALPEALRQACPLVIVGRPGWSCEALVAQLQDLSGDRRVRWLRDVDDDDKRALMQSATALVFPTLFEGFGLPVLEGFASQTPVITSNVSSLPEVAGDGAWLVDPLQVPQITEAMATLAREDGERARLVALGLKRARQFTWQDCAARTLQAFKALR
jgi:alpha-1,3-rhamnosyl/mannosyltransferase